jgi:hypothetical protein
MTVAALALATSCLPGADINPKAGPGNNPGNGYHAGLLTNVRFAAHTEEGGYDRVVFDFLNFVPGWEVSYVEKPILSDPGGEPLLLGGDFAIKVRLSPASQTFMTPVPPGAITLYPGPLNIQTGLPQAVDIVRSGDFEGVLSWNIGTRTKAGFRVQQLDSPHRLVVDISY